MTSSLSGVCCSASGHASVLVSEHLFPWLLLDSIVHYQCAVCHTLSCLTSQQIDNSGPVRLQFAGRKSVNFTPFNRKRTRWLYLRRLSCSFSELRMMAEGRFASLPRSLHAHHTMGGGAGAHPGVSSTTLGGSSTCSSRRFQTSLASSMDLLNSRPRWAAAEFLTDCQCRKWVRFL